MKIAKCKLQNYSHFLPVITDFAVIFLTLLASTNSGTVVAKCLFVIVGIEVENQYLFIVHRLRFRLGIDLVLGFVYRLFLRDLFYALRQTILSRNRNRLTKPIVGETILLISQQCKSKDTFSQI